MHVQAKHTRHTARSGNTLVEVLIAATLFSVVFLSSMALMESGQRFSKSTLEVTNTEDLAQQMLFRIERTLANSRPVRATTTLAGGMPSGAGVASIVNPEGFPPSGAVLVEPSGQQELATYQALTGLGLLAGLTRGQQCTPDTDHAAGLEIWWAGVAETVDAAVATDGTSLELGTPTRFRGRGTGFSFEQPVDPTGGNNFLSGADINWGANVRGIGQTTNGRSAIYFEVQTTFDEATENMDVNDDGDRVDVFDVGQLRRVNWNTANPNMGDDVGLGPSVVLQEQCNWGGDLDGDGFDDPLFLWNPDTSELHVRIFILGLSNSGLPIVRRVESTLYLRNQAADS